jgi:hypothetical protein
LSTASLAGDLFHVKRQVIEARGLWASMNFGARPGKSMTMSKEEVAQQTHR